jgi:hypothetical protein
MALNYHDFQYTSVPEDGEHTIFICKKDIHSLNLLQIGLQARMLSE